MQKKIIVIAMGALLATQSFAQQNQRPPQTQPVDPSQRVVISQGGQGAMVNSSTPQQSANPYGSVNNQGNPNIQYDASSSNINGYKNQVGGQMPNPAQAQAQMGVPVQPPSGLPQDSYNNNNVPNNGQIDPVQATINILNTPNAKIRKLSKDMYSKGKVMNEAPVTPPKSINGVLTANLSPGSTPPVIRLSQNRSSAIIITDTTGQPWPIINYDGLSEEDFTVKRLDNPSPDGYVLSVTPKNAFVSGNLVLILKGLPSPLSIDFVSAQKEVDSKTEIRVQAKGPNTQYSSISLPEGLDTSLLSLLQGVAPQNAKELKTSSNAVQAWLARDGKMYVRTRYKVMSPAFENVTSSPDGTYAYKMVPVPVVLYKAAEGKFGEFTVEGF